MKKACSLLALSFLLLGTLSSCKKEQYCKCTTANIVTDYYKHLNETKAATWCDEIEVQMNNGITPQKDTTHCELFLKK